MSDVLLVCMPFGPAFFPSIGLSLLKSELAAQGIPADIKYFSMNFAERLGQAFYCGISTEGKPPVEALAGEWIFSGALFESTRADGQGYLDAVLRKRDACKRDASATSGDGHVSPALIERILRARDKVDDFLQWCLDEVIRQQPRVIGFTSVFQQHVASLALAKRVKQVLPRVFIVFGGANCEGVMGAETVRQFPFVDAVVSGEGDLVFPELVRRVLDSRSLSGLQGIRTTVGVDAELESRSISNAPMVRNLDDLPYPDYDDFFAQFEASRYSRDWQPGFFFETSRGCWWGERMHCTFCGLNGATMTYRSKSARRAMDELVYLIERHPGCDVHVTDNILDMGYFKDFLPELGARRLGTDLFYETKANLKKEQVQMLRTAGIGQIQPGIESFSDPVLKLMRKGVSALQNIQLLKWCKELGIEPHWNLLWGFPGEPPEEYARMAKLVPLLTHLPAPVNFGEIRLDRFSPNFFDAERLGFTDVKPLTPYRFIYPLPGDVLANLAYYFAFRYREPRDVEGYVRPLARELHVWRTVAPRSDLFSVDKSECLLLWDLRPASRKQLTVLRGLDQILYQTCDAASDLRQIAQAIERRGGGPVPLEEIGRRLETLLAGGLLVKDQSRYLALAIPLGQYSPAGAVVDRFYEVARALGTRASGGLVVPLDVADDRAGPIGREANVRSSRRARGRRRKGTLNPSLFSITDRGELLIGVTA